jgi:hypothetical protein
MTQKRLTCFFFPVTFFELCDVLAQRSLICHPGIPHSANPTNVDDVNDKWYGTMATKAEPSKFWSCLSVTAATMYQQQRPQALQ